MAANSQEFSFEIVETYAVLLEQDNGWTKEFNLVRYGDGEPKFDLRAWSPDHGKMSKGITLSREEAGLLKEALAGIDL